MKTFNIIRLKSPPKNNFFAPEWDYFIYEDIIKNVDFNKLSLFILKKEKEIVKKYKYKDGDAYTGLGKNSLSSRWKQYNVLKWKDPEIDKIKNNIIKAHDSLLEELKINNNKLYIQCWAVVMRKGEKIKAHIHSTTPDSYLGGHICVQAEDTRTAYINPVNQINDPLIYYSKNDPGKITLFQQCIPHFTDTHKGDKERITIAFDLFLKKINDNMLELK